MSLYQFENGLRWCDDRGFPAADGRDIGIVRKEIDLRAALRNGEIRFGADGVYLKRNGKEYRGYIYLIAAWIKQYGSGPKFHLRQCSTIQDFINGDKIQRYGWSNAPVNDIQDIKDENFFWRDYTCEYCGNCRKEFDDGYWDTEDFHADLTTSNPHEDPVEALNIHPEWKDITRRN